ncbi:hypothetical protein VSK92_21320 [Bacillus swezeyi]|uniref:hypothetical protein n=1 Tax=Bacillus swezeyi TaxID=1925020 RepID=UPI0039C6595D
MKKLPRRDPHDQKVKHLELSELKARCRMTLHEQSCMTGNEIAKQMSTSRSNVF